MKKKLFIAFLLSIITHMVEAQTIPRAEFIEKQLTDKISGWKFLNTNDKAMNPGADIYFYFLKDGQLNIYAQKYHNDPNRELIYHGTYTVFNISTGRVGITIKKIYGNIKLFFISKIHQSKIGDTSFEYFYNSNEKQMRLIYSGEEGKLYYVNTFQ